MSLQGNAPGECGSPARTASPCRFWESSEDISLLRAIYNLDPRRLDAMPNFLGLYRLILGPSSVGLSETRVQPPFGFWSAVARSLPGRDRNACQSRFRLITRSYRHVTAVAGDGVLELLYAAYLNRTLNSSMLCHLLGPERSNVSLQFLYLYFAVHDEFIDQVAVALYPNYSSSA